MTLYITSERNVQGTDSCLQDEDRTDGHYITLFAEQLTRPFEVLVKSTKQMRNFDILQERSVQFWTMDTSITFLILYNSTTFIMEF